jgi:hypothetical protein
MIVGNGRRRHCGAPDICTKKVIAGTIEDGSGKQKVKHIEREVEGVRFMKSYLNFYFGNC